MLDPIIVSSPQETLRRVIGPTNADTPSARITTPVNVTWFGAVGNGIANDYAPLQAAIDSLGSAGGVVYLPGGNNYKFGTGLTIGENVSLIGDGVGVSILTYSGSGVAITVNCAGNNYYGRLAHFSLTTTASPLLGPGTHGIRLKNVGRVTLNKVRIRGFSVAGLHFNAEVGEVCLNITVDDCIIEENQDGIIATGGNALINHVTILNSNVRANVGYNVYGNLDMRDWTLIGTNFEAGNTTAVFLNAVLGLSIVGCYFEQIVATPAIHLSNNFGASGCSGVILSGNHFSGVGGTAVQLGTTSYVSGVNAGGNWFGGTWTTAINGVVRGGMIGPNRVEAGITELGANIIANSTGLVVPGGAAWDFYTPTSFNANATYFQYPTPNANLQTWKVLRDTVNDEWGVILQSLGYTRAGIRALVENAGNNRATLKLMVGDGSGSLVTGLSINSNLLALFPGQIRGLGAAQNVTGSRGGNAALASLLTALAAIGLITDNTS